MIRNLADIGQIIRERRQELGLTQIQLAGQAGVSRHWIVEIEQGKPRAQLALLMATLKVLRLDLLLEAAPESSDLDSIIENHTRGSR